jgi:hypothetical protein
MNIPQPRFKHRKGAYGALSVTLWLHRKPYMANTRIYDRTSDLAKFDTLGYPKDLNDYRQDLYTRIEKVREVVALYRDQVTFTGAELSRQALQRAIDEAREKELNRYTIEA